MPLQGTFDVLNFSETLRLLSRQSLTGRLHLRSRSYGVNLFFEDGALVGADQSEHPAAAAAGDVRNRLEEICFEMLEADRGSFEFQPGKPTALPGAVRLKVETVLTRARKRHEEWRVLIERVPSLEVQPRLVADLDASEVTLDKQRWKMLTVVDGRRNLRTIGRTLNLSDFDVCRVLVDLLDAGVVELDGAAAVLAASGRDLIPTIPLPEGLSESLVDQGPAGDDDIEDVKVTRVESGAPRSLPRAARRHTSEAAKQPGSTVRAPGTSPSSPPAAARAGGDLPSASRTPGPAPAPTDGSSAPGDDQPPVPPKRRARRRTPGGGSRTGGDAATPGGPGGGSGGGSGPSPAQVGDYGADHDDPAAKRPRRVVRIRSRLPRTGDTPT
ncbi:MAG: DUF4388 domain-containing protein [Actinomycetota bacterium]|nr:DUF4388 domain-containing protein [Actinomycetota bacterium]